MRGSALTDSESEEEVEETVVDGGNGGREGLGSNGVLGSTIR